MSQDSQTEDQRRSCRDWQDKLWSKWPRKELWPAVLDLYEVAAYYRVHPATIRRAVVTNRQGRAKLPHRRIGSMYRFDRDEVDAYGRVFGQ